MKHMKAILVSEKSFVSVCWMDKNSACFSQYTYWQVAVYQQTSQSQKLYIYHCLIYFDLEARTELGMTDKL